MPKKERSKHRNIQITIKGLQLLYLEHVKTCKECTKNKAVCEIGKKLEKDMK